MSEGVRSFEGFLLRPGIDLKLKSAYFLCGVEPRLKLDVYSKPAVLE
jgi:hypothetical protein